MAKSIDDHHERHDLRSRSFLSKQRGASFSTSMTNAAACCTIFGITAPASAWRPNAIAGQMTSSARLLSVLDGTAGHGRNRRLSVLLDNADDCHVQCCRVLNAWH